MSQARQSTRARAQTPHMFLRPGCRAVLRPAFGSLRALSAGSPITSFDARVTGIDDGSESLLGQAGHYKGPWDPERRRPHGGVGVLVWDNGISYEGEWRDGRFDGQGASSTAAAAGTGARGSRVRARARACSSLVASSGTTSGPGHSYGIGRTASGPCASRTAPKATPESENGSPKPPPVAAKTRGPARRARRRVALDGRDPGEYSGGWTTPRIASRLRAHAGTTASSTRACGRAACTTATGASSTAAAAATRGAWARGKRAGHGITFFDETHAHGVLRWEGPFVDDKPHESAKRAFEQSATTSTAMVATDRREGPAAGPVEGAGQLAGHWFYVWAWRVSRDGSRRDAAVRAGRERGLARAAAAAAARSPRATVQDGCASACSTAASLRNRAWVLLKDTHVNGSARRGTAARRRGDVKTRMRARTLAVSAPRATSIASLASRRAARRKTRPRRSANDGVVVERIEARRRRATAARAARSSRGTTSWHAPPFGREPFRPRALHRRSARRRRSRPSRPPRRAPAAAAAEAAHARRCGRGSRQRDALGITRRARPREHRGRAARHRRARRGAADAAGRPQSAAEPARLAVRADRAGRRRRRRRELQAVTQQHRDATPSTPSRSAARARATGATPHRRWADATAVAAGRRHRRARRPATASRTRRWARRSPSFGS